MIHGVHLSKYAIIIFVLSDVIKINKTHTEYQCKSCSVIVSCFVLTASMYEYYNNVNEQCQINEIKSVYHMQKYQMYDLFYEILNFMRNNPLWLRGGFVY